MPPETPRRIQRQRTRGWRMPENTVYVGRPGWWGNPFPVDVYGADGAVERFRRLMEGRMSTREMSESSTCTDRSLVSTRFLLSNQLYILRGKNLACWCALDQPCHADVLLEIANA